MQNIVGQTLANRYRVEAFLDRGGMAAVYRATDLQRNIPVVMKVLKADLAEDIVFLRRFAREATVLQRLNHPHIVHLYGFERFDHLACLFLEYIDGITLRRRILDAGGPFSTDELRAWVRPICAGLSYAHGQGVFHCDIKPANVMVMREGRVVVSDFGIARTAGGTVTTISTPGTPDYMAPEQWLGRKLDARTDVYALGVTLFSMVTGGERPFIGESPEAEGTTADRVRWEHLYQPPPSPRVYNASLSPALEALILRALAKEPSERFPTVGEFYLAFEDTLSGPAAYQVPISPAVPTAEPSAAKETPSHPERSPERPVPPLAEPVPTPRAAATPAPPPQTQRNWQKWGIFTAVAGVIVVLGIVLALAVLSDSNNPAAVRVIATRPSTATLAPTATPKLTATPTATPTPTVTPTPTATPRPTQTPTPSVDAIVLEGGAELRPGATTWWFSPDTLSVGTELELAGYDADFSDWVYVRTPDGDREGWTPVENLQINRGLDSLPQVTPRPTLTSTPSGTLPISTASPERRITGIVLQCGTSVPIPGTGVYVGEYHNSSIILAKTVTGADGQFVIENPPVGLYHLCFSSPENMLKGGLSKGWFDGCGGIRIPATGTVNVTRYIGCR
jgi:serine/threonine protein kinase